MTKMVEKKMKVTIQLPCNLVDQARGLVARKRYPSFASLVRASLEEAISQVEREQLLQQLDAASQDPLFLMDIREVGKDFAFTDQMALRSND
jgi:Arc/MetJ-type ribon-helix-helix transcriptional regulator